ncbi:MAG: hypothetical protein OEW83_16330 [Acidimicrobiia bacterium]|nr:hypothetical protein [Acidimicrobiia bacterium]
MKVLTTLIALFMVAVLAGPAAAEATFTPVDDNTYGSVEPVPNPAIIDTTPIRDLSLTTREALADRILACGVVDDVITALTETGAISTITASNSIFDVSAGGFAGSTSPAIVYTMTDSGPGAASHDDIEILTDSLGYVFSQGSAFLLDADNPGSFGFPANYAVMEFASEPTIEQSAALFETVGAIDPELFETFTSGYTQYGASYLTLQSDVPDQQFIDGYVAAAEEFGVEYQPVVGGVPSLFRGGADFPFNDWSTDTEGEGYLSRIPAASHDELAEIRDGQLAMIEHALRITQRGKGVGVGASERGLARALGNLPCR